MRVCLRFVLFRGGRVCPTWRSDVICIKRRHVSRASDWRISFRCCRCRRRNGVVFFFFLFAFEHRSCGNNNKKRIKQRPSPSKLKTKIKTKEKVHFDGRKYSWAFFYFFYSALRKAIDKTEHSFRRRNWLKKNKKWYRALTIFHPLLRTVVDRLSKKKKVQNKKKDAQVKIKVSAYPNTRQ